MIKYVRNAYELIVDKEYDMTEINRSKVVKINNVNTDAECCLLPSNTHVTFISCIHHCLKIVNRLLTNL